MELVDHVGGIRDALASLVHESRRAGLDARVPTAPEWDVRHLVAHQGSVHRWATAKLRGQRGGRTDEGLTAEDPLLWLHEGCLELIDTIESVPDDVEALVFLEDAPPPRQFWARRQCHETTIHAVDAVAAAHGRMPLAEETSISRAVALDGIDELVTGFVTQSHSKLRSETPTSFAVRPTDSTDSWHIEVSQEPAVTQRRSHEHADVVLRGTAVQLYLALWSRGDEVQADGFDLWKRSVRIV